MRNQDVAARTCANCHRVFSKVEHLRRHERAHTGERPFKCKHCGRKYARSDVLNRHVRHHHPEPADGNKASQAIDFNTSQDVRHESTTPRLDDDYGEPALGSRSPSPHGSPASVVATPTAEEPLSAALYAQQSNTHDWESVQFDVLQDMNVSDTGNLDWFIDACHNLQGMNAARSPQAASFVNGQQEKEPNCTAIDLFLPVPEASINYNMTGLLHTNMDIEFRSLLDGLQLTPPRSGDRESSHSPKNNITNEQFEQVRRLWPTRRRTSTLSPTPVCWDDILLHPEDNVFSSTSLTALATLDFVPQTESLWKFTDACRARITQTLSRHYSAHTEQAFQPVACSPGDGLQEDGLPPIDILELCLDLYFHRFLVHMPFVHPATFDASATSSLLLFPMCVARDAEC